MNAPVDLVRATLEQAWRADCPAGIYLARQVVELRGLVAADRARIVELEKAARALLARMPATETPEESNAALALLRVLNTGAPS